MMKKRKGSFVIELIITFPFFLLIFFYTFSSIFSYGSQNKIDANLRYATRVCALNEYAHTNEQTGGFDYYLNHVAPYYHYSEFRIWQDGNVERQQLFVYKSNTKKENVNYKNLEEIWKYENVSIEIYLYDNVWGENSKIIDMFFSIKVGDYTYYLFNSNLESTMQMNIERSS